MIAPKILLIVAIVGALVALYLYTSSPSAKSGKVKPTILAAKPAHMVAKPAHMVAPAAPTVGGPCATENGPYGGGSAAKGCNVPSHGKKNPLLNSDCGDVTFQDASGFQTGVVGQSLDIPEAALAPVSANWNPKDFMPNAGDMSKLTEEERDWIGFAPGSVVGKDLLQSVDTFGIDTTGSSNKSGNVALRANPTIEPNFNITPWGHTAQMHNYEETLVAENWKREVMGS